MEVPDQQQQQSQGFIALDRFEPVALRVLGDANYIRDDEDKLYTAFSILDRDKKGFLTADEIKSILTTEGETFSQEELDEFMNMAFDPLEGKIFYEKVAARLASC